MEAGFQELRPGVDLSWTPGRSSRVRLGVELNGQPARRKYTVAIVFELSCNKF